VHQRRDEHGLARAGEAGHAKPNGRVEQMAAELQDGACRQPGLFGDRLDSREHGEKHDLVARVAERECGISL